MAKNVQHPVAKSIRQPAGSSSIAHIEGRTTTEVATATASAGLKTGKNFTGQYLFNRFVENDKTEITKLDIVRSMVTALDIDDFKKIVNDFVGIATSYRDKAITAAKDAGTYDAKKPSAEIQMHMARVKTAQNHQAVMRVSFGALKFASDKLEESGYNEQTGYHMMAVISRKALAEAGIKWDGTKVLSVNDQQRKAQTQAEKKALDKIMDDEPRQDGESIPHYLARCAGKVADQLTKDNVAREQQMIKDLIVKVRKLAGGMLDDVVDGILRGEGKEELAPDMEDAPTLDPVAAAQAAPVATKH